MISEDPMASTSPVPPVLASTMALPDPLTAPNQDIEDAMLIERMRFIHKGWFSGTIINYLAGVGIAAMFYGTLPPSHLWLWFAAFTVNNCYQLLFWFHFHRAGYHADVARRWFKVLPWHGALHAAFWGAGALLLPDATLMQQFVFLLTILLMLIGATFGDCPDFHTFLANYLTAGLPTIVVIAVGGTGLHPAFALILLLFAVHMLSVGRSFNKMYLENLQRRYEKTDLLKALAAEKEAATAAHHAKSQFLAAASHDLRQPTHALGLFVSTLTRQADRYGSLSHTQVHAITNRMQSALGGLSDLLTALQDISRLDAGVVKPKLRSISLAELFLRLEHRFAAQAEQKNLRLRIQSCRYHVRSDGLLLDRTLSNLLSNAIRYTENGQVLLGCRRRNKQLEIQVIDTGIGIAAADQARIFEEFVQLSTKQNQQQGLGLGLAIVQRNLALLRHSLRLHSSPGRGTLFAITVPLSAAEARVDDSLEQRPIREQETELIVVLDDEPSIRQALSELLTFEGYAVIAGATPQEIAKQLSIEHSNIVAIVSDLRLGETLNGVDAVQQLRQQLGRPIPAVIITGDTAPERLQLVEQSGLPLLHKPVTAETLLASISQQAARSGAS